MDAPVGSLPFEILSGDGDFMCNLEVIALEGQVCGTSSVGDYYEGLYYMV